MNSVIKTRTLISMKGGLWVSKVWCLTLLERPACNSQGTAAIQPEGRDFLSGGHSKLAERDALVNWALLRNYWGVAGRSA